MQRTFFFFLLCALVAAACSQPGQFPRAAAISTAIDTSAPSSSPAETEDGAPSAEITATAAAITPPTAATRTPGVIEPLADGGVRLSTDDGLTLTLDAAGQITALTLNGDPLPITPALPLRVRDLTSAAAPEASNQLANPGFEDDDAGWSPLLIKNTTVEVAADAAHEGSHALAIRSEEGGQGAIISDPIPVIPGVRYRVSGRFRADFGYVDDSGNPTFWQDSLYASERLISGLYLQWLDADGSPLQTTPQLAAPLHWNAHDWHQVTREVTAPTEAASVQVIAGVKPVSGAIWIDDLAWVQSPEPELPLEGSLEVAEDYVAQTGEVAGLQAVVAYRPYDSHIAVTVSLSDPTGGPRALDAAWGLPLALTPPPASFGSTQDAAPSPPPAGRGEGAGGRGEGWYWWDGLRQSRPVTGNADFARAVSADITGYLPVSLYPYAMLEDGARGLALALPLDSPRYVLLRYDGPTGRYEGRAHLGISPEAAKLNNSADFTLLLYQSDPAWGLRAAAQKHVAINPDWYEARGSFEMYTDYVRDHFGASGNKGLRLREYNDANVYAAQYTVFELPLNMQAENAPMPSFAEARQFLDDLETAGNLKASYPVSVICDSAGEPHLKSIGVYPWSDGQWNAIWIPDVDPDLPDGYGARKLAELEALFAATEQAGLRLDGVFIDNFISTSTIDLCPAHLAAADLPLTYDPNTYQPGVHTASAGWEFLTALRALLDGRPDPYRNVSINFWALNIPTQLAPYIDAFGGEGASAKGSNWTPEILDYRMATALGRPRLFANQQSDLTMEQIETFVHEALFYGIRPSRGPNAANWPTGYEALLEWGQAQVEAFILLGWQPFPLAHTDHPNVWVERFGNEVFTVHNWSDAPADFTLTIDVDALGLEAANLQITESVSGEAITPDFQSLGDFGSLLEIQGHLEPGRTAVYWLK